MQKKRRHYNNFQQICVFLSHAYDNIGEGETGIGERKYTVEPIET